MILTTVVAAVFLGIFAQVLAERFKLPAILPLLLFGIVAGPYFTGLIDPEAMGHGVEELIHLGVAVILFEGGLSLDPRQVLRVGGPVRNLLTVGALVTGVGSAIAARLVTGLPWETAALFGAIVTVTGPTVIVPLLRHMIAPRKVKTILVSEGLIIDPIGAVLAYLVLQWIERASAPLQPLATELLVLAAAGSAIGFVAGSLAKVVAKSRLTGGELRNLAVLALVLLCFLVSERVAPQSGILAVVVMGFTLSASEIPDLEPLRTFKGQLTTLLISVLFVFLAAQLDLAVMFALGWSGVLVALLLIFVVRPISVAASVYPSQADWRERALLAASAPRGIVAAAVASLAARDLDRVGLSGGATLEGLVYLVIMITGAAATVSAIVLPRILGWANDPSRRLTVLVGAHALSRELGAVLEAEGRKTVVVDSVTYKLDAIRRRGIEVVRGDARDAESYEKAGVERDTTFVAMTTNDELNLLAAELARDEFGVDHPVILLQAPSPEFGSMRYSWIDLLGSRGVDLPRWLRLLEMNEAEIVTLDFDDEATEELHAVREEHADDVVPLCGWQEGQPRFRAREESFARYDRLTVLLVTGSEAARRLEPYVDTGEGEEAGSVSPEVEPALEGEQAGSLA